VATKPLPAKSQAAAPKTWTQAVREQLKKLDAAGQFYPSEAIARGLEGEVAVLLIIDEGGQVTAARVEQSSGHASLDEAALRAVRTFKSLPADAPRQTVLPVRFRLR
jgi:protein TonB